MKQRNDVIAKLYDVALSPHEFDELILKWEDYLAALEHELTVPVSKEPASTDIVADEEISAHFTKAALILQKLSAAQTPDNPTNLIRHDDRSALIFRLDGTLEATNLQPNELFYGLNHIDDLQQKLRKVDYERLLQALASENKAGGNAPPTVIVGEGLNGEQSYFVFLPAKAGNPEQTYFILRSLEPRWSPELQQALIDVFELTERECEIVEAWCQNSNLSDLAKAEDRSLKTIRTQVKNILGKTGAGSQTSLMRLISGLSSLFSTQENAKHNRIAIGVPRDLELQDGRRLEVTTYGPKNGKPIVLIHGMLGGMVISNDTFNHLIRNNIKLIIPLRPSYGRSDPIKNRDMALEQFTLDIRHVLDELNVKKVTLIGYMAGTMYAFAAAKKLPDRVDGIINFAGCVPITSRQDLLSMRPRQSIMAITARYMPSFLPVLVQAGISQIHAGLERKLMNALYKDTPQDLEVALSPEVYPLLEKSYQLTAQQGSNGFVDDAAHITRDWSEYTEGLSIPILFLHGDKDPTFPLSNVQKFANKHDNVRLQIHKDCGQLIFYKNPKLLFEALKQVSKG